MFSRLTASAFRKIRKNAFEVFGLLFVFFFLSGSHCEEDPPGDGFLLITAMTTDISETRLDEFRSVSIDVDRIDVVYRSDCEDSSTEEVRTIDAESTTITLSTADGVTPRLIARLPVAPGCVSQVRLISSAVRVDLGGEVLQGRIPSGPQTGLKINPEEGEPPFPIESGRTTAIRVQYDPNEQLVINRGQGLLHKPTIEAVLLEDEDAFPLGIIPDELMVTFEEDITDERIADVVTKCGGAIIAAAPRNYLTVKLPPNGSEREAIRCYSESQNVVAALPDMVIETQGPNPFIGTPDDPYYNDTPPDGFEYLNLDVVNAQEAWALTTGGNGVVVAVVDSGFDLLHEELLPNILINEGEIPEDIRDSIRDVYPRGDPDGLITFGDLNQIENEGICPAEYSPPIELCDPLDIANGYCFVTCGSAGCVTFCDASYGWQDARDNDNNGYPDDLVGWDFGEWDNLPQPPGEEDIGVDFHGTAVAGIAVGAGNNAGGREYPLGGGIGVAWNTALMLVKGTVISNDVEDAEFASIPRRLRRGDHVRGIQYALENGARVVNSSVGAFIAREDVDSPDYCYYVGSDGTEQYRGIRWVLADKFTDGLQVLEAEWEYMIAPLMNDAVLVVSASNCQSYYSVGSPNVDDDGFYMWPGGFTVARPEYGLDFIHSTMIGVNNFVHHDVREGTPLEQPAPSRWTLDSRHTITIAAPGTGWRVAVSQSYPPEGMGTEYYDCPQHDPFDYCHGTSLAAPVVSGAAALIAAQYPDLTALEIRQRIIDLAARPRDADGELILGRIAEDGRMLDIGASIAP